MAETPVPITYGSGQASIAGDVASGALYQQIKLVDGTIGSNTALIVNSDGTLNARISGSVATAGGTFTGSVSGTVGSSVIGTVPVTQVTNPWIITGSVQGSFTAAANQSVSGTVGASLVGQLPAGNAILGAVAASISGTVNIAGSVAAFQAGTHTTSVSGQVTVVSSLAGGIFPISGSVAATITNTNINVSGSVVAFQGTNPFIITGSVQGSFSPAANQSVSGTVQADIRGSIAAVIIGGSIATATTNSSVMLLNSANTIGSVATLQGTNPWIVTGSVQGVMSVLGTVPVTQATASNPWIITGSVQGSFSPAANQSVSGTVQVDVRGSIAAVIIGGSIATAITNSSVMLLNGANVIGSVAALQGTNPWIITSSVAGGLFPISGSVAATITNTNVNVGGSVVAFQGTSPFVVNFQNSSIIAIQAGSVISINIGSTIALLQAASIVGTYAEDAAAGPGDKGLFLLGVRNDVLSSVTNATVDYSQITTGPAGEVIVANSPLTRWIQGTGSTMTGASVAVLAAQGAAAFTYVTAVQVSNPSAVNVMVKFADSDASILGFTMAPATGGSNILLPNAWKTGPNKLFTASIVSGVGSVYVSAQGFTAQI